MTPVPGRHTRAGKSQHSRPMSRLGVLALLVAAATFATIGLDWGGVFVAALIVIGILITGLRDAR